MIIESLLAALLFTAGADADEAPMQDLTDEIAEDVAEEDAGALPEPVALPEGSGNDCFRANSISNFEILDRENLVVFAPSRRSPYWVKVAGFCQELRYAHEIGFDSRDGRICSYGGDAIVTDDSRCSILSIHRLDEAMYVALKEQIAADRAARRERR